MRRFGRSDGTTHLADVHDIALKQLIRMYRRYCWDMRHVITSSILIKAQEALYGGEHRWTKEGLIPDSMMPARFLIGKYLIEVQVPDAAEARRAKMFREEIWPDIVRLSVLWKPDLKLLKRSR